MDAVAEVRCNKANTVRGYLSGWFVLISSRVVRYSAAVPYPPFDWPILLCIRNCLHAFQHSLGVVSNRHHLACSIRNPLFRGSAPLELNVQSSLLERHWSFFFNRSALKAGKVS